MDPSTVFLLYAIGTLSLWLLTSAVRPAISVMADVGSRLTTAKPLLVLVISTVLLFGSVRPESASASVGPANQRMEQMAGKLGGAPHGSDDVLSRFHSMNSISSTHVVVKGDSLWRIARSVLADSDVALNSVSVTELWQSIYELNRDLIGDDPNLIHPGQILKLPGR